MRALMIAIASAALLLSGCSEPDQSPSYNNTSRSYSGKSDARPWEGPPFEGDKAQWNRALAKRAANQNEYSRTR